MAINVHPSLHVHPGPWLRKEFIEPYGLTMGSAAEALGVAGVTLNKLVNGKTALAADMALRFEKAFGLSAETLMQMQIAYALAHARCNADRLEIERIPAPV